MLIFYDNIWDADFVFMQLISKFNKGTCFALCVIGIIRKYALVILGKKKKGITITNAFQKILGKYYHKLNKIWVDKGSGVYNRSTKSSLQNNNIEMYSLHKEEKSVVAERSIRTLKNKIYKYMTSLSKKGVY